MIRCDFETCTMECKYYRSCNLHQPITSQLLYVRKELNWLSNHLREVNEGINHFNTMLIQYERGNLSEFIVDHISRNTIENLLSDLHSEKRETISQIREYQIKENNMVKILNRRQR